MTYAFIFIVLGLLVFFVYDTFFGDRLYICDKHQHAHRSPTCPLCDAEAKQKP